jgi:hypothetical protein
MSASPDPHDEERERRLREELGERDVEGIEKLPPEEQEEIVEAARSNPDPTTRRETIEQELMEHGDSDAGADLGE